MKMLKSYRIDPDEEKKIKEASRVKGTSEGREATQAFKQYKIVCDLCKKPLVKSKGGLVFGCYCLKNEDYIIKRNKRIGKR